MPKPYPEEFRRDVVAVARKRETPWTQLVKDFEVSEACIHNWVKKADIEDGWWTVRLEPSLLNCGMRRSGMDLRLRIACKHLHRRDALPPRSYFIGIHATLHMHFNWTLEP